ncbi:hypothetical protein F5883DRAFT_671310 [Diaporthe sp. PMI_573]|nr:hypothetical protein F5883DRAFT_671310 [Diaporthaceae sp. PMI_573]
MPHSTTSNNTASASSSYRRSPPAGDLQLLSEAPMLGDVPNVSSALNLEPSTDLLRSTAREQPFETGKAACMSQLDQPGGPQVVDGLGWNNCRECCAFLRGPAHPAIPSAPNAFWVFDEAGHAFSQHQPSPPARRVEVLSAAPELEAARDDFPATGPDQSFGLLKSSCYDEEYGTVDAEFIREFGQFVESQQASDLQPKLGQKHSAFVEGPAHHAVPSPPSMVGFEDGAGADLTTWLDRWLANECYGLQEEMSLDHWPISDLRPDLDERRCPEPDEIDERIYFHTALSNGDMFPSDLWWSIMDEMSLGAIPDDKAAVEKSDGQPDCGSEAQHSYEDSVDEVLGTRAPGSDASRKGHCYPQTPSDHQRSARKRACRASASFVGEVAYVGKLDLSDTVAVEMFPVRGRFTAVNENGNSHVERPASPDNSPLSEPPDVSPPDNKNLTGAEIYDFEGNRIHPIRRVCRANNTHRITQGAKWLSVVIQATGEEFSLFPDQTRSRSRLPHWLLARSWSQSLMILKAT